MTDLAFNLNIPDDAWRPIGATEEEGGEWARIILEGGALTINHASFHLEGWQVNPWISGEPYYQRALQDDDGLEAARRGVGADEPLATVSVDGRPYVLFASPHGD